MQVKSLYLRNFRNIKSAKVHFSPYLNIFYGKNAQGKTNLLEAIFLLSTGKSFRTKQIKECINHEEDSFYIEAKIEKEEVEQKIAIYYQQKEKVIMIDNKKYHSFQPLLGKLPSVIHMAPDQSLISGSPSYRRRFINLFIAQFDALYVHHFLRYIKAMKNRNILLKKRAPNTIDVWEKEMSISANYIYLARRKAIDDLNTASLLTLEKLTNNNYPFSLQYCPSFAMDNDGTKNYLMTLQKDRLKDMKFGYTSKGPHRDDFMINLDHQSAKLFASEGQKRTFLSALRLTEQSLLTKVTKEEAIMNIDDLDIHLDENHQKLLHLFLTNIGQVFITTPTLSHHLTDEKATYFTIKKGEITVVNFQEMQKIHI